VIESAKQKLQQYNLLVLKLKNEHEVLKASWEHELIQVRQQAEREFESRLATARADFGMQLSLAQNEFGAELAAAHREMAQLRAERAGLESKLEGIETRIKDTVSGTKREMVRTVMRVGMESCPRDTSLRSSLTTTRRTALKLDGTVSSQSQTIANIDTNTTGLPCLRDLSTTITTIGQNTTNLPTLLTTLDTLCSKSEQVRKQNDRLLRVVCEGFGSFGDVSSQAADTNALVRSLGRDVAICLKNVPEFVRAAVDGIVNDPSVCRFLLQVELAMHALGRRIEIIPELQADSRRAWESLRALSERFEVIPGLKTDLGQMMDFLERALAETRPEGGLVRPVWPAHLATTVASTNGTVSKMSVTVRGPLTRPEIRDDVDTGRRLIEPIWAVLDNQSTHLGMIGTAVGVAGALPGDGVARMLGTMHTDMGQRLEMVRRSIGVGDGQSTLATTVADLKRSSKALRDSLGKVIRGEDLAAMVCGLEEILQRLSESNGVEEGKGSVAKSIAGLTDSVDQLAQSMGGGAGGESVAMALSGVKARVLSLGDILGEAEEQTLSAVIRETRSQMVDGFQSIKNTIGEDTGHTILKGDDDLILGVKSLRESVGGGPWASGPHNVDHHSRPYRHEQETSCQCLCPARDTKAEPATDESHHSSPGPEWAWCDCSGVRITTLVGRAIGSPLDNRCYVCCRGLSTVVDPTRCHRDLAAALQACGLDPSTGDPEAPAEAQHEGEDAGQVSS
jgi:hypothetical protein